MSPTSKPSQREVAITRAFDAPREAVFRAWTDPEQLAHWFAPRGCTVEFRTLDLREGGAFHFCMRSPNGLACCCKGVYRELIAPERIVFTMTVTDERGAAVDPTEAGMDPQWPRETTVTAKLAEAGGKTRLALHQTVEASIAERSGATACWQEMFDRLAEELDYLCELAR
jgi:uncharacterized protein YndB with AHSA1/START domain